MTTLRLDQIEPNPRQPRKDCGDLAGLAASIGERGLLEPVMVRPVGDRYQIIHGERRWRACRIAGLLEIEVVIREATDEEAFELALIENLQREDLNPIEEGQAYAALVEVGWTQERVAGLIGKSQQLVASRLVLLRLPEPVRAMVTTRVVSASHAEVLAGLKDPAEQVRLAERIAQEHLSVRALRKSLAGGDETGEIVTGGTLVRHFPWVEGCGKWTLTKPGPDSALAMWRAPGGGKALFHQGSLQFDESGGEWTELELCVMALSILPPLEFTEAMENVPPYVPGAGAPWWWGDWAVFMENKAGPRKLWVNVEDREDDRFERQWDKVRAVAQAILAARQAAQTSGDAGEVREAAEAAGGEER